MVDAVSTLAEGGYQVIDARAGLDALQAASHQHRFGRWEVWVPGLKMRCHDLLSFYHTYKDIFGHRIYDFQAASPAPLVLDGGGHIGMFTLYVKQKYPQARVIVFEPEADSLELLEANLALNQLTDVRIVRAGLFNTNGTVSFASDHSDGSSIFTATPTSTIPVVKLSDYLTEPVDFLKLNIEGAETVVIEELGDRLQRISELVIEYHGFPELGQPLHGILQHLDAAGFRYVIHDLDAETNPVTKPPFRLGPNSRFFLWIYAKRMFKPSAIAAPTPALDRVEPISRKFGFDRGTPLDRYYMQQFLRRHRQRIQGRVLEIGDRQFTEQFGTAVTKSDVFSYVQEPGVTIVGDLATGQNLPVEAVDCFIMTQTIQMIYDAKGALGHAIAALKPGGTLLVTASGISQISRYDMDRWGEFWRFTDRSLKTMLAEFVPESAIEVETFGNVAVAKAFLDGLSLEELPKEVLDHPDPDYQVLVAARVTKPLPPPSPAGLATMTTVPDSPLVLLYHRVADDPVDANLLAVSPTLFESQLRWLAEHTRVVPLHDLLAEAQEGRLEPNTVAITFDDGYLDNLTNALPLLERYRLPATIFITSGRIDSGREIWWDALERIFLTGHPLPDVLSLSDDQASQEWDLRTPALRWICHDQLGEILHSKPSEEIEEFIDALFAWAGLSAEARESHRFLTTDQLQRLAASPFIEIGSHSVTHSCMRPLSAERQRQELLDSKHQLERVIGKPVRLFSYPFGNRRDFSEQTMALAREVGYEAAIANVQGSLGPSFDPFAVPRRLVRNWSDSVFATWMGEADKDRLEQATLEVRFRGSP